MKDFSSLLKKKYGEEIYESLVKGKKKLSLKKGIRDELYKDKLETSVIDNFDLPPNDLDQWAYDFPGWIGKIKNKGKKHNKEIMVIGLEPHISSSAFQVTYGLRETQKKKFDELAFGNNKRLWNQLFKLFNDTSFEPNRRFLKKFYITDLCHFAPRGQGQLTKKIPNWKKIRRDIALRFLPREIELLQPKYIVSHGVEVCNIIDNDILKKKGKVKIWLSPQELNKGFNTRYKNVPFLAKYKIDKQTLIHVGLPHLASGNTLSFWKNTAHIDYIKNALETL